MNLQKVLYQDNTAATRLICYGCGRNHSIKESYADHDGPAFQAYYCTACALPLLHSAHVPQTHAEAIQAFERFINQRPNLTLEEYGFDPNPPRSNRAAWHQIAQYNMQAHRLRKQDYGAIYRAKVRADKALDKFASPPFRAPYSPARLASALQHAFSGRLNFNSEGNLEYTACQTFAEEYRDAAASVLEYYNRTAERE